MANYTPMLQRYLEVKNNHEDSILLYQMGDFYEMFFEDAVTASKILHLTLTSRSIMNSNIRVPMCGLPVHAVNHYVAKLTASGKKVVVCDHVMSDSDEFLEHKMRYTTPMTVKSEEIVSAENRNIEDQCSDEKFQQLFYEYSGGVNKSILDIGFMLKEFKNLGLQRMAGQYDEKNTKNIITKPLKRVRRQLKTYAKVLSELPSDSDKEMTDSDLAEVIIAEARKGENTLRMDTRSVIRRLKDSKEGMKNILEMHLADFNYQRNPESSQAIVARCLACAIWQIEGLMIPVERAIINSIR